MDSYRNDKAQRNEEPKFIASYLQLFLYLLIHSANSEKFALSPDIGRTLNYILDNITEELPLEELAALANLSCSQYKQKFKKQLGISPRSALLQAVIFLLCSRNIPCIHLRNIWRKRAYNPFYTFTVIMLIFF